MRWIAVGALLSFGLSGSMYGQEEGAELYRTGCAVCHGADGSGLPADHPSLSSFGRRPPSDFTDPLFNSREPSRDWFLVVKYGGTSLGLSDQMPAYGSSYSDAQIEAVVAYVKRIVDTSRYPPGELNFLRPTRTIKAFPEDEALLISRYQSADGGSDTLKLTAYYARRFGSRWQVEVKGSTTDVRGNGSEEEIELGLKWAFYDNLERSFLTAAGVEAEIPLQSGGDEVLIPYWSAAKGLGERFTLQSTLRSHLPTDDVGDGDVEISAVVHYATSVWPRRVFPGLEAVATFPFEGGDVETSLLPQLYVGLTKGGHVALSLAGEVPLDERDWDYRLHAFLLWEFVDGPLWAGW